MMTLKQEAHFIDLTARMALRADAATFVLGYLWWILEPLLFVAIFYLVFAVILDSPRADFLSFLVIGKLPFQWFSGGLNTAATAITSAQSLIAYSPIPKSLLVWSKLQQTTYKQIAVFALMVIYLVSIGQDIDVMWLWVLAIVATQYVVIAAFSLAGAIMVCVAQDFAKLIQLFTIFMMFSSGIFWDVRSLEPAIQELIFTVNPLAFLLDAYRQVLLYNQHVDLHQLLQTMTLFAGICGLLMLWIRRHETWLALRVLSR